MGGRDVLAWTGRTGSGFCGAFSSALHVRTCGAWSLFCLMGGRCYGGEAGTRFRCVGGCGACVFCGREGERRV